ncbi:MAG: protein kinase [Candidatus Obscuribacter sp.]|nr:protein kinase [Candidatus Obscuribacter sp.]
MDVMTDKNARDIKLNDNRRQTISRVWAGGSTMGRKFDRKKLDKSKLSGSELKEGTIVGGAFKIVSVIGRGGMGVVYKASQTALGRVCALKVLSPELVNAQNWKRFQNEAKVMAGLTHPCLIQIYDLGIHDSSLPFYAMDYLQGQDLETIIRESGPLSLTRTIDIFVKALDGFGYAHRNGIIHRDIKPGNIFLCNDPSGELSVKILDFGILKLTDPGSDAQSMTATGEVFGSPFYMSPEQCMGEAVDARSDIYSIGCSLYEVLTGVVPFDGETPLDTVMLHIEEDPPTLSFNSKRAFAPAIERVVARCLAKEPRKRYQNAKELALDLERIKQGKEPVAEPVEEVRGYSKSGLKSSSKADKKGSSKGSDNKSASKSGRADKNNQNKKWSGNKNKNEIKQVSGTVLLAIGAGVAALLIAVFTCTLFMGGETEQDKQKKQAALINSAATAQTEELRSAHIDRYVRDPNATQTTSKILTYNGKIYADDELSKQYPGMTVFDFPDDDQIGTIDYCTDEQAAREFPTRVADARAEKLSNHYPAKGRLLLRQGTPLEFVLTPMAVGCTVLKGFRANDLYKLDMDKIDLSASKALEPITKLKGLRILTIRDSQLTAQALPAVNSLKSLKLLRIDEDNLANAELAKLQILPALTNLEVSVNSSLSDLLDKLKSSKQLRKLELNGQVSTNDITAIQKINCLKSLVLINNTMSEESLTALGKLTQLEELELKFGRTNNADIKLYSHLSKLPRLIINEPQDMHVTSGKYIKKQLPNTKVIVYEGVGKFDSSKSD